MSIFSKKDKRQLTGVPDAGRMRYEIARNIYPVIIKQCYREAHTESAYRELPETATRKALEYAEALMKALHGKEEA